MSWSRAILQLSPDAALLLLTLGLLLIYFEFNRPGAVLPGALGLTLALVSTASLSRLGLSAAGVALVLSAIALLALDLFQLTPPVVAAAATLALCLGFDRLTVGPDHARTHPLVAALCGLVVGAGTSVLTRIARRARANKAVD